MHTFEYKIGFKKSSDSYALLHYNSPYRESEQELDDIRSLMETPGYKVVKWEELGDGRWEVLVECRFLKNEDNSYDQIFVLLDLRSLDVDVGEGQLGS